jgi:hypothetical protein
VVLGEPSAVATEGAEGGREQSEAVGESKRSYSWNDKHEARCGGCWPGQMWRLLARPPALLLARPDVEAVGQASCAAVAYHKLDRSLIPPPLPGRWGQVEDENKK